MRIDCRNFSEIRDSIQWFATWLGVFRWLDSKSCCLCLICISLSALAASTFEVVVLVLRFRLPFMPVPRSRTATHLASVWLVGKAGSNMRNGNCLVIAGKPLRARRDSNP